MPLKHELQYARAFGMAGSFAVDVLSPLPIFAMLRRGKPGLVPFPLHSHGFTVGYFLSDLRSLSGHRTFNIQHRTKGSRAALRTAG